MKLSNFLKEYKVIATGFPAVAGLGKHSEGKQEAVLTTLAPEMVLAQGANEYFALELPRNAKFNSSEEIIDADLNVNRFSVHSVPAETIEALEAIIVSRHEGTIEILKKEYPEAPVFPSITSEEVAGKHVIGTLPPHLVAEAAAYTSVTIKDFNYQVDGDLVGSELVERLLIAANAIKVKKEDLLT